MGVHPMHWVSSLFILAVVVGALTMVLKSPAHANALVAAGADTITGVTHGLEGKK